ncbi:hypothetical protein VTK56DRAFT_5537 [Thermocarpiscus australiensis]
MFIKKVIELESGAKLKHLELQVERLERKCEETRTELQELRFLLAIGDWLAGIHNVAKSYEAIAQADLRGQLEADYKAKGVPGSAAQEFAKQYDDFKVAPLCTSTTSGFVERELALVEEWRAAGEPEGSEPQTPYLDRLQALADKAKLSRAKYVQVIRQYGQRNDNAHSAPPRLEDHLKADLTVDWSSVKAACEVRK